MLPADMTVAPYPVEWATERELLPLLHREIGCEYVDSFRIRHPLVDLAVWVDDTGLLADTVVHNDRALTFARTLGYMAEALAGNAVLTGPPDPGGDMTGLPDDTVASLVALFARTTWT